jgi:hypothetical protein
LKFFSLIRVNAVAQRAYKRARHAKCVRERPLAAHPSHEGGSLPNDCRF